LFPDVASRWHPTKNGDLTPEQVVAGSHQKVWWRCHKGPDHEWEAKIADECARRRGVGCPFVPGDGSLSLTPSLLATLSSRRSGTLR
ncbi:MAG: zinc-ribbon domain-containing protein, partial [Rubrobacter sp.]|nr:zinc-ribbon domain-containing protein [Rubrobacter sp.]